MLDAILPSLGRLNREFTSAIEAASREPVPASSLNLEHWPKIIFTLTGTNASQVPLTVGPDAYRQVDCPAQGQASFVIGPSGMPQSILGLPLMNNYYCMFDRTEDSYGVIRFAHTAARS